LLHYNTPEPPSSNQRRVDNSPPTKKNLPKKNQLLHVLVDDVVAPALGRLLLHVEVVVVAPAPGRHPRGVVVTSC
jgi:hypothetical protein